SILGQSINGTAVFTGGVAMADIAALTAPLHAGDNVPVLIYANEDIKGGIYTLLKSARVWAGRDILNLSFVGMNTGAGDITSIAAGRDIRSAKPPTALGQSTSGSATGLTLYGPGDFLVSAGRDLGPFAVSPLGIGAVGGGILAIGDGSSSSL